MKERNRFSKSHKDSGGGQQPINRSGWIPKIKKTIFEGGETNEEKKNGIEENQHCEYHRFWPNASNERRRERMQILQWETKKQNRKMKRLLWWKRKIKPAKMNPIPCLYIQNNIPFVSAAAASIAAARVRWHPTAIWLCRVECIHSEWAKVHSPSPSPPSRQLLIHISFCQRQPEQLSICWFELYMTYAFYGLHYSMNADDNVCVLCVSIYVYVCGYVRSANVGCAFRIKWIEIYRTVYAASLECML